MTGEGGASGPAPRSSLLPRSAVAYNRRVVKRPSPFLLPAAVVLAGVLAYSSAFPGAFVYDDAFNVARNRKLDRPLDYLPGGPGWAAQPNRAVVFATFALDRAVAGNDPTFHRAVNVAIHVANALLVAALVLAAFGAARLRGSALAPQAWSVALLAALLFVAHPLQTQAVTYVVQRLASLATFFYLAATVLYLRWRLARDGGARGLRGWWAYGAALAATLLAMRSKEIAFTLPVALLLVEAVLLEGPWRRRLPPLLPFAATMILIPATLLATAGGEGAAAAGGLEATRVQTGMSRLDYLLTQSTVLVRYLGLAVAPVGQTVDHDVALRTSLLDPAVLGSTALLLALAGLGAWLLRGASPRRERPLDPAARLGGLGIAWFFLTASVESSVIPIVDLMYEHRAYLPMAGLCIAAATGIAGAARRLAPARAATATAAAGAALAVVLGAVTWNRNAAWSSEVALWSDAVRKTPGKARPRHNLGVALSAAGRRAEALPLLEESVRLDPAYAKGHESLAVALADSGRTAEAEAHLRRAVELDPRMADAWFDLGTLRFDGGRYAEAVPYFEKAVSLAPEHARAWIDLAASWNGLGRADEAVRAIGRAPPEVAREPLARAQVALALARLGDLAGARREVEALRRAAPAIAAQVGAFVESQAASRKP